MSKPFSFTIVVPTRNDPGACEQLLEQMLSQAGETQLDLRIVFLANDTRPAATTRLDEIASSQRFRLLQPKVIKAAKPHPTAEENIRHTLGDNLDEVDDEFIIIGNTDCVLLSALDKALEYMRTAEMDLLLIGLVNREVKDGRMLQQFYTTPRHVNPKNRLKAAGCHGEHVFSDALSDYGPVDYLAFIGCQIYTKRFFKELCLVEEEFIDPLYSHSIAALELTTRRPWNVGFFPEVSVVRVDDTGHRGTSPGQYRTARGQSSHILLSVLTNSLHLSPCAFQTLVNAQMVSICPGKPRYSFSNFLFMIVLQMSVHVMHSSTDQTLRYTRGEQQDIVAFGKRLQNADIGLTTSQTTMLGGWLQHFDLIGDYLQPGKIDELLAGAAPALALLDTRPGNERWIVELASN